jgi:Tol biopolymer transport system component/DNA-binding winged helix-turn-helix (wHTH) protein
MSEQVAVWPKLTLAREAPFSLAGTHVRPAALEVETGGRVTALEPRVMKVLVAMHRASGHPVSRDELIDICWDGRIVTEGALNRCVMQLRKALLCNPRIKLDTIPTVGYRLQGSADIEPLAAANTDEPLPPGASSAPPPADVAQRTFPSLPRRWLLAGAVGAAVVAIAGVTTFLVMPKPVTWTAQSYTQLTADPGMETHPALSPNGQQLVYSQRVTSAVYRDLFIRSVDQGTPVRITSDPADDHSAAWSPNGDRIAFIRTTPGGRCTVLVVPMPVGAERTAARCQQAVYSRVSWLDADTLVFSDRPTPDVPWRIRSVDLTSGNVRDLTAPSPDTLGDGDPMVSPDGKSVVFRRTLLHGADDLFLKDLKTGRERALTTDGWKAAGYVWSHDSRHIFYSSNRGGEFGLWTVDTARREPPKRISLGAGQFTFSRMSSDRRNRLAVEAPSTRTNIVAMGPDGVMTQVTNAASSDWEPEGAADGTVAYVSNRSGASELWITRPDGQSVRLTGIMGSYTHSPAWSPDGQTIAFVAVKGRKAEIYTVGRDGSRLRAVTADGLDKLDPIFTADGRGLRYVQRTADGYRVMQIPLTGAARPQEVAGGGGLTGLRRGPEGRWFGQTLMDSRVVALDRAPAPDVRVGPYDTWTVGPDGVYVFVVRGATNPPAVWLHPWTGPARKLREVGGGGDIGVAADGRALFSQYYDEQVDLGLFALSSR